MISLWTLRMMFLSSIVAIYFGVSSCGAPERQNANPEEVGVPYPGFTGQNFQGEKNFAHLLNHYQEGKPSRKPWAGFWWPYTGNGIASGAYGRGISPAGKYDAVRGGKTTAQGWELRYHGTLDPKVQGWWGHCNGWSAASVLFDEPRQPVKVNGINFSIADVKALLSEVGMEVSADFFGERVDWGRDYNSPKFWDVVPNQFFLVLTNYMGKFKQSVLIDRYTGDQVWNQPVAGYRFEYPKKEDYLGADPEAPHVFRITITSTIWWVRDDVVPDAITPEFHFEENGFYSSRILKMELWLDGPVEFGPNGKITTSGNLVMTRKGDFHLGGVWKNGVGYSNDGHPDYMWIPYSVQKPTEYANKEISFEWIEKHILSGGKDDPSVMPSQPAPAPPISPRPDHSTWPSPHPSSAWPTPWPTSSPTPSSVPIPSLTPTTTPVPTPTTPAPRPTPIPRPEPTPSIRPHLL